jgi:flagellin
VVISINQNISSLRVQRSLSAATGSLSRNLERVSSGQRINRASDDAAGLAIAESLKSRSKLYDTASRNINDGISALNIAGSALDLQIGILQRLSELAEQSANGTYSDAQRASTNTEYQALVKEFGRTGDTASFNGLSLLLAGRPRQSSAINLQTGIDGRSSSNLSVSTGNSGTLSGTIYASSLLGSGVTLLLGAQSSFDELSTARQGQVLKTSLRDDSGTEREVLLVANYDGNSGQYSFSAYLKNSDIGPDGYIYGGENPAVSGQDKYQYVASINIAVDANGRPTSSNLAATFGFNQETISGTLNLDVSGLVFARSATPAAAQILTGNVAGSTALELSGVENVTRARAALTLVQARLSSLSTLQGQFGAARSRLESNLNVAAVSKENTLAAESRIRNVDIAEESAQLTASQIRQQTAAQVLAQANTQPNLALQLLRI